MKKSIITLASILIVSITAHAQQKHLPKTVTVKLTDQQVIAISGKIDSLEIYLQNSNLPSNAVNGIVNRTQVAFAPLWNSIREQMVADSVKKEEPKKKKTSSK